jgi:hypothetical protein
MSSTDLLIMDPRIRNLRRLFWILPLLALASVSVAQDSVTDEAGVQVLTRGPVHEAFAEASMTGAKAGIVVSKSVYDPIVELPPDQRPEGNNVAWIPGYWSWDDDRTDFIWCSGVWRDIPPGRQWVPGYWASAGNGSQWISGFWGDVAQTEVTYLPAPPEPLEYGPNSPAPRSDNIWTSGSWVWQQTRYDWQPGYWVPQQPDWVWSPAHYTWTPRGYVYVPGYWDRDLVHRGVMFAPVYYAQPVHRRPDYYYSPRVVIDITAIIASLFVQPRSNRYYYGDYYDSRYDERGIYPWHSETIRRYGDDPIYSHYRSSQLRRDPDWDNHIAERYRYRRDHVEARPPQTLALQVNFINNRNSGDTDNVIIGRSLADTIRSKTQPLRFRPVDMDERKQIETRGREVHKLQFERAKIEAPAKDADSTKGKSDTPQVVTVKLPVSPVAARPSENVEGAKAPPPMPVAPKPQVAEGRRPQVKPSPDGAKTEASTTPKKPDKAKPVAQTQPEKAKKQPAVTSDRPRRVDAEKSKRDPDPRTLESRPEPSKKENIARITEPKSRTQKGVNSRKQVEARPEAKSNDRPHVQDTPRLAEADRKSPKPGATKAEVRAKKPEPKKQTPRTGVPKHDARQDLGLNGEQDKEDERDSKEKKKNQK